MVAQLKAPVVVGVDGTGQGLHAVQFAVAEAQRVGCGVRLVHVVPELAVVAPIVPWAGDSLLDDAAGKIMDEAEQAARTGWHGLVPLERVLRTGRRVPTLVQESEGARLVVLGHRDRPLLGRVLTASTSTGVAGRARCPVVCLPTVWQPASHGGGVVVGIEDPDHAYDVLSHAFVAARTRAARLRVLHAWKLQRPYDDLVVGPRESERWTSALTERLGVALRDLRSAYPEVEVDVDVRHQEPMAALLGATEGSDLLVIGRRGHGSPVGLPMGGTARAMIRESRCPVEIAPLHPASPVSPAPDLTQMADELSPQT